jgi:hypothetical protein
MVEQTRRKIAAPWRERKPVSCGIVLAIEVLAIEVLAIESI